MLFFCFITGILNSLNYVFNIFSFESTLFVDFCYTIRIITRIFIVFNIINSIFNFYPSKLTQERYEQLWYEASTSASSKSMTHKTLILNAPCSISRTIRRIPPKKHWKHRPRVFWGICGHQNLHSCVRVWLAACGQPGNFCFLPLPAVPWPCGFCGKLICSFGLIQNCTFHTPSLGIHALASLRKQKFLISPFFNGNPAKICYNERYRSWFYFCRES